MFVEVVNPLATSTKYISNFIALNDVKISLYNSVSMRIQDKKVCISDEAERVQSVSYSHKIIVKVIYSGVRKGKRSTLPLAPPFQGPRSWYFARKYSSFCVKKFNIFHTMVVS